MIDKDFDTLFELQEAFPDELSCIQHLEWVRWKGNVVSPFDPSSTVYKCKNNQYRCKNTGAYFNVRTKTMYENSKIPLRKWFMAVWMVTCEKKGVTSTGLARKIGVSQKTSWLMLMKIRKCFGMKDDEQPFEGEIEVDETFVGGKNKNRHRDKKAPKCRGRAFVDKTPVFGMIERGGRLMAQVIDGTSAQQIVPIIHRWVRKNATIYSDEWCAYRDLHKNYSHEIVDHGRKQYKNGNASTNCIEGFWGIFKKGMIGVYQCASRKHMQKYVDEFVYRFNTRKMSDGQRFSDFLTRTNSRLLYKELIYG